MRAYIVCKDCCEHLSSINPDGKIAELENLANKFGHSKIFWTGCLGICPKNKISVIALNEKCTNDLRQIKNMKLQELEEILS